MQINFEQLLSEDLKKKDKERILKPRDYIYASEVGQSLLDCWLSLRATPITNPVDDRVLRTFQIGHIFEDYIASLFPKELKVEREVKVELHIKDHLPIHGRIDFIVDGIPVELKTVNSRSFWHNAKDTGRFKPYPHHVMQLLIYMLSRKVDEGILVYISKDDATIEQVNIKLTGENDKLMKELHEWMAIITECYRTGAAPAKEDNILFENGKYKANWKVIRSRYFTYITGTDDPHQIELEANRMNYKLKKESLNN